MPNIRENRRVLGILPRDAVNDGVPIVVIVRLWLDEGIERIHKLIVFHNYHTYATHAGALVVGGLEIYGGEVVHLLAKIQIVGNNASTLKFL